MLDTHQPLWSIAPFVIPAALAGLSFLSGLGKNKSTQTSTTTPTFDPAMDPLKNLALQFAQKRLSSPSGLPPGFEANGISRINETTDLIGQSIGNRAAAAGVSGGPSEQYAHNIADINRGGQINTFRTGLPLLERDLQNQDLAQALSILSMGRGTSTTGETSSGGGVSGGLDGLASMLGFLYASKMGAKT